jgi:hypothetical protein
MKYLLTYVVVPIALGSSLAGAQVIYNNASTAAEGYQRGMSSVISAAGEASVNASQARINNQDAYSKAIDNSTKSVQAFWEQKDIYQQRVEQKNYKIQQRREMLLAKNRLPPLSPEEFDRTTGTVTWPKVLTQSQYDQYRNTLDTLLKKRSYAGMLTSDEYMQATAASKEWRAMLAKQKDVYPSPILHQLVRFVLRITRDLNENLS